MKTHKNYYVLPSIVLITIEMLPKICSNSATSEEFDDLSNVNWDEEI